MHTLEWCAAQLTALYLTNLYLSTTAKELQKKVNKYHNKIARVTAAFLPFLFLFTTLYL
jgi:hypothetical protein